MSRIVIGIIGFGTVGAGTYEILTQNRDLIAGRVGSEIVVKRIADLDLERDRGIVVEARDCMTRDAAKEIPLRTPRSRWWWS